jgi:general secretion pathway protein G
MKKGFTLIELLVVVAIIALLAGLVTSATQTARKRGARGKAEAAIATVEAAVGMYESDLGTFPESGNENLVKALSDEKSNEGNSEWNGPYMRFKEKELEESQFVDPWGLPYVYVKGGTHNGTKFYDLYSLGSDGKESEDDVTNW